MINILGSIHPWQSQTSVPGQMGQQRPKGEAFKICEHGPGRALGTAAIPLFQRITAARSQESMVALDHNWNTPNPAPTNSSPFSTLSKLQAHESPRKERFQERLADQVRPPQWLGPQLALSR